MLKAKRLWFNRLKLKYNELHPSCAFSFKVRRYKLAGSAEADAADAGDRQHGGGGPGLGPGRGLHSFIFQLNLSRV